MGNVLLSLLLVLLVSLFSSPVWGHALLSNLPPPNDTTNCHMDLRLEWSTRVSSSVVASPTVVDIGQDGEKELLIPTFSNYVEVLRGSTGEDYTGFPFVHPHFKSYASAQAVDVDGDGVVEQLIATYTGELLLLGAGGKVRGLYRIPGLSVKKKWWEQPDSEISGLAGSHLRNRTPHTPEMMAEILRMRGVKDLTMPLEEEENPKVNPKKKLNRNARAGVETAEEQVPIGPGSHMSREAFESLKLIYNPDLFKSNFDYDDDDLRFHFREIRASQETMVGRDEVLLNPHILSSPVLVDIDNNGDVDAILHVTYFFDPENPPSSSQEVGPLDHYLATSVVCLNLVTGEIRWTRVLELTKKSDVYPSYGVSTPLVIDGDESNTLEIFVTSTTGRLSCLRHDGSVETNWSVFMGPISASPVAEDVNGDGKLEICVGDVEGKVACYDRLGERVWLRHVMGAVTDRVTFGDVNGDGAMEVVVGTAAGLIYVLNGTNGEDVKHSPIVTGGSIHAPVLLVKLKPTLYKVLHLVVPSHDGNVYLVDMVTGCIEIIDVDEKSTTMVLAEDLTGSGYTNLILTTVNGGVYVFESSFPYHPLNTWSSDPKGLNGATANYNYIGVYIKEDFRNVKSVRGDHFFLPIVIEDRRPTKSRYLIQVFLGSRVRVYRGYHTTPKELKLKVRTPLESSRSLVTVQMTLPNGQVFTDSVAVSFNEHFLETVKYTLLIPFFITCFALSYVHKRHEVEYPSDGVLG